MAGEVKELSTDYPFLNRALREFNFDQLHEFTNSLELIWKTRMRAQRKESLEKTAWLTPNLYRHHPTLFTLYQPGDYEAAYYTVLTDDEGEVPQ